MGLVLILVGLVIFVLASPTIGIILMVLGVVLLFLPGDGWYGYSRYHSRRGP